MRKNGRLLDTRHWIVGSEGRDLAARVGHIAHYVVRVAGRTKGWYGIAERGMRVYAVWTHGIGGAQGRGGGRVGTVPLGGKRVIIV